MCDNLQALNFTNEKDLSFTAMIRIVLRMSIPAILAQLTSIAMQYIDSAMVGSLGAGASASIGLVSSTIWLINGVGIAAATGFSVQIAQLVGAKRDEDARNVFRQSILIALLFGVIVGGISVGISAKLPAWLGGNFDIRANAASYFLIYACALPASVLRHFNASELQCSGDMRTPSMLSILLCLLDVIFNMFFIYPARVIHVLGSSISLPGAGLGVTGAALGTACAEVCIAVLMLLAACIRSKTLAFRLGGKWKLHIACMKNAFKIAFPAAVEKTVMSAAYIAATLIVAPLGTVAIAANSLAVTAESFCYMPGYGIASAATTLVGQSIGAKRNDLARRLARSCVALGVIMMTITAGLMFVLAPLMFRILTPSAEVRTLGTQILRIVVFAEPFFAASIVCSGALYGAGDTLVPSILNLLSMWGVRITTSVILVPYLGLHGVWIAMAVELCIRGILFLIRLFREKWLRQKIVL